MSCSEFQISTTGYGRAGLGVIQPQSGLDFPLVFPSEDIRYLLADFYLAYEDGDDYLTGTPSFTPPFSIKHLYNVGCVENTPAAGVASRGESVADIVIYDSNQNTVLNTTTANITSEAIYDWGTEYKIYEWVGGMFTCRMLVYTTWPEADTDKRHYDKYLTPLSATLDTRTVHKIPKHVLKFYVRQSSVSSGPFAGDVIFKNGYNTEIVSGTAVTVNTRRTTNISFAATPGTGAGKYPCTGDEYQYELNSINGVPPNTAGHFTMAAKDCLFVRRPTNEIDGELSPRVSSEQKIGADCQACCSCDDYTDTALRMNEIRDKYSTLGSWATAVKEKHISNIARWNAYRQCTISNPLKITLVPQRSPFVDIALMLCNNCEFCFDPATLTVAISIISAVTPPDVENFSIDQIDADVVCGYTEFYFPGFNGRAISVLKPDRLTYTVNTPRLKNGESGYVKFRLGFNTRTEISTKSTLTGVTNSGIAIPLRCGDEPLENAVAETRDTLLNFNKSGIASRC
jgi:hypothetical protein